MVEEREHIITDDVLRDWKARAADIALRLRRLSDWAEGQMYKPLLAVAHMADSLEEDIERERRS